MRVLWVLETARGLKPGNVFGYRLTSASERDCRGGTWQEERRCYYWIIGYYLILVDTRFAAEEARVRGRGQKPEGGDLLPGRAVSSVPSVPDNVSGFLQFRSSQRARWDALKSEFCPMFTGLGTLGRFVIWGSLGV